MSQKAITALFAAAFTHGRLAGEETDTEEGGRSSRG